MGTIANNGIINLIRGDSFEMSLPINLGTKLSPEYYTLKEGDNLYFGLMEPNQPFENAIVKKKYDNNSKKDEDNNILLTLNPEDTEYLSVGKYYYMVKLRQKISEEKYKVTTIINPTLFWLEGTSLNAYDDYDACNNTTKVVGVLSVSADNKENNPSGIVVNNSDPYNPKLSLDDTLQYIIDGGTAADLI